MGFFDRFTGKKPAPEAAATTRQDVPAETASVTGASGVKARLVTAREKLEGKDLSGAMAIYEEVLAVAGDRADVLVTISGDLGSHGHVAQIIELVAPRYDADRHGPATGLNLLQAYLGVRNADAAQHILDILFGLNRPELEDRLHGFSNAVAELMASPHNAPVPEQDGESSGAPGLPKVGLISISKPIWFYGLEELSTQILPPKDGRLRRIGFAQLALPALPKAEEAILKPEDELGRLSRALPMWFAETFYFSSAYAPIAAIGIVSAPNQPTRHMIFGGEWTTDNLRQLVDSTTGGLDYIFAGALRNVAGDYELVLRLFEVKSFRERKKFLVRWTPATMEAELKQLHGELRRFMEWSPAASGLAYTEPPSPRSWLETLGASVAAFVAEKGIVTADLLRPLGPDVEHAAAEAATSESAALAYLTLRARAAKLGAPVAASAPLAASPLVQQAAALIGR